MTIPDWVQDAIFYQIFPDRFARSPRMPKLEFEPWEAPPTIYGFKGGDLYGVVEKLEYLDDLGINAIYLNPVFASAANHRYHTYDYYQVDPLLGGNPALRLFLDEAHKRDFRVVLDGVFNHASRGFWQFHHVLENGLSSPYVNWFHFDPDRLKGHRGWGAYPDTGELHALEDGEGSLEALGYKAWWDLPALPKLNTDTPAVRAFLFDVAEHWMRFGIDGWRLDVPTEIDDDSFWREFRNRVRGINPEAYIVGEIWHESDRWLQGDQFDAVMNYLLTGAVMSFCGGPNIDLEVVHQAGGLKDRVIPDMDAEQFGNEIDRLTNLYKQEIVYAQLNLLDSHDMPRFLTCVQNDFPSLQMALLFIYTYPGAPCLFYGDEVGVTGAHDPDCRKGFPWDNKAWDEELLDYTKKVIKLRKGNPALRRGTYRRLFSKGQVFGFERVDEDQSLIVILNASQDQQAVAIPIDSRNSGSPPAKLFGSIKNQIVENKLLKADIPARSGAVLGQA